MAEDKVEIVSKLLSNTSLSASKPSTSTPLLLAKDGGKKSSLIQEIGDDNNGTTSSEAIPNLNDISSNNSDDGPSLLEMMIQAQKEAKQEKEKDKEEVQKKEVKQSFNGFKKGFFGDSGGSKSSKSTETKSASKSTEDIPTIKAKNSNSKVTSKSINNINNTSSIVIPEVQEAMNAEKHPIMQQIESKEWVTDDLMTKLSKNDIVSKGMRDSKCMAAMQLLQQDPKQAMQKYQSDPEVSMFLREFSKIMADHFEALGSQQQAQQNTSNSGTASNNDNVVKIEEVGPLQAKAIQNANKAQSSSSSTAVVKSSSSTSKANNSNNSVNSNTNLTDEERVQQILNDPELRVLLMDTEFQRTLMECGDPRKLAQHMRDPDTARKIRKMKDAGLVQIQL